MISFSDRAASLTLYATLVACAPDPVVPMDMPAIDAGVAAQVVRQSPVVPAVLQNVARAKWLEDVPDGHWTGLSPSGRCDAEGTPWIGRSLRPDVRDRPVHCAFDWSGDGAPDGLLLQKARGDIIGLQRDPPAVVAQAELTPDLLKTWSDRRHKLMYERLGKPRVELKQTGRVRVAVIDTASGVDADVKDDDGHGSAMGLVIREIACTTPACIQSRSIPGVACEPSACTQPRMFYYPALGRRTQAGRAVLAKDGSGRYGTRSDLAQAIERAVDDWMSAREAELQEAQAKGVRPPTPERLIVNLSLGWSGCWNDANWKPGEDPVYHAVLRARCHGAVVVAAAGNIDAVHQPSCPPYGGWEHRDGGPVKRVYPAQFLNEPDTATLDCNILGDAPRLDSSTLTTNLLLGVSAVDEFDNKLSTAAQESTLVSFGQAIPTGQRWHDTVRGTSLSAATTSGVVAGVWLSNTELTANQVETQILSTAVDLRPAPPPSGEANFLAHQHPKPGQSRRVQRISFCAALGDDPSCARFAGEKSKYAHFGFPLPEQDKVTLHPCDRGTCKAPRANAIDSMEEPWAETKPVTRGCGTCYMDSHERGSGPARQCGTCYSHPVSGWRYFPTFVGLFPDGGTPHRSFNGQLQLGDESYLLWSSPPGMFVTAPLTAITTANGASIHYQVLEEAGVIEYDEPVVVELPQVAR